MKRFFDKSWLKPLLCANWTAEMSVALWPRERVWRCGRGNGADGGLPAAWRAFSCPPCRSQEECETRSGLGRPRLEEVGLQIANEVRPRRGPNAVNAGHNQKRG